METKTWAKRVAAVTTGALMLGATLMGAMAYDLKDFPAPFVANGMLSDTVIVVGAAADTADVLGSVDIAAALQAAAKTPAGSGTTTEATATAGKKIDKSGDAFNYNEDIYDVVPETFDEGDLPELLADVEFNDNEGENTQDEDYSQELSFTNGNAEFVFETPDDGVAGNYVKVTDGAGLYTYTLEFDSAIDYDTADAEDDLVGTKLEIMGKTYTITDVSLDNSDFIDSVTMVAGDSTVWLAMDHPLEFGGDTITVVDVADDGTKCGVDVNGHVEWVSEGTTSDAFPSDLSVGVLEAVETASEGGNACELSLGSAELLFTEGDEVDMNGELIDGTTVDFTHDAAGEWTGFTVTYETEFDGSDDVYLAAGDAWTDPVFGTFKVHFAGVNANYEDMAWSASGDDATFTFTNNDGKDVEVAWHRETGTTLGLGWADDEPLLLPGENSSAVVFDTTDLTNVRMLYTTSGGEAHVLRVKALDCEDSTKNTTDIYDETYDRYVVEDKEVVCDDTFNVIALGSLGSINLSINSAATVLKYDDDADTGDGTPESEFEGTFVFNNTGLSFTEKDGDE
ncbi:MAG: hypothetical protein NDI94_05405, partial [Candidatus Woesearchaeota archaeon]|nr:hypothetical protein [Candidatus Woesearchaeota archaeon]